MKKSLLAPTDMALYQKLILRSELLQRANFQEKFHLEYFADMFLILIRSPWYSRIRHRIYPRVLILLELLSGNRPFVEFEYRKRNIVTAWHLRKKKNKRAKERLRQQLQEWKYSAVFSVNLRYYLILQFIFILRYNVRLLYRIRINPITLRRIIKRKSKLQIFYSRKYNNYYLVLRSISRSFLFTRRLANKTPYSFAVSLKMIKGFDYPHFFFFFWSYFKLPFKLNLTIWPWGSRTRKRRRHLWFYLRKLTKPSVTMLRRLRPKRLLWRTNNVFYPQRHCLRFGLTQSPRFLRRRGRRGLWKIRMRKKKRSYEVNSVSGTRYSRMRTRRRLTKARRWNRFRIITGTISFRDRRDHIKRTYSPLHTLGLTPTWAADIL